MRHILAVVAAIILGGVTVSLGVLVSSTVYPLPEGIDPANPEHRERLVEHARGLPTAAFAIVLVAHASGALVAGAAAAWISRSRPLLCALIAGVFFLLGGIGNLVAIPHPLWFAVVDLLLYLPAAWAGATLAARRRAGPPEPAHC